MRTELALLYMSNPFPQEVDNTVAKINNVRLHVTIRLRAQPRLDTRTEGTSHNVDSTSTWYIAFP